MNYLVFLKLGGTSNARGNDLPDEHPSLLETFGQLGAVRVTIRHPGPAPRGPLRCLLDRDGRAVAQPLLALAFCLSRSMLTVTATDTRHLGSEAGALPAGPSLSSFDVYFLQHICRREGGR